MPPRKKKAADPAPAETADAALPVAAVTYPCCRHCRHGTHIIAHPDKCRIEGCKGAADAQ